MDIEKSLLLLEETFDTIKKINLTNRTYKNIKPLEEEYSTYDEWIVRFLAKGSIHPEDVEEFLDKTKILTLQKIQFNSSFCIRERINAEWHWVYIELIRIDKDNIMMYIKCPNNENICHLLDLQQDNLSLKFDKITKLKNQEEYKKYLEKNNQINASFGVLYSEIAVPVNEDLKDYAEILSVSFGQNNSFYFEDNSFITVVKDITEKDFQLMMIEFYKLLAEYKELNVNTYMLWSNSSEETLDNLVRKAREKIKG